MAFSTLLICGAMSAVDPSHILAAKNLGASRLRILFDIILPQVMPTIGVATVLSTVTMMSVLSVPLMIGTGTPTMMTVDMAFRVNSYGDYPVANAMGGNFISDLRPVVTVLFTPQPANQRSPVMSTIRHKIRGSFILQTLLLTFLVLALFGPLLNLLIWTVAESWFFPHALPGAMGAEVLGPVFSPYSDVSGSLSISVLIAVLAVIVCWSFRCRRGMRWRSAPCRCAPSLCCCF